jgi:hypothetical protein
MSTRIVMQMLVRECELFHTGKMNLSATSPTLANKLDARGGVNMKQHEAVASGPRPLYQLCAPQAPSLAHSRRIPAQVGTVDSTRTFVFRSIGPDERAATPRLLCDTRP